MFNCIITFVKFDMLLIIMSVMKIDFIIIGRGHISTIKLVIIINLTNIIIAVGCAYKTAMIGGIRVVPII